MRWFYDRAGFPMLELPTLRLAVHLLPVAKHQFERFLADPGPFGDTWYEEILAISPRISLTAAEPLWFESYFMSGLHPVEITPFAKWLGRGFELPSTDTWRAIDHQLAEESFSESEVAALRNDPSLSGAARHILGSLAERQTPQTWGQLSLMRGGLLEWVKSGPAAFGGLGMPRPELQALIVNPQRDPPVRPIDVSKRYRSFGFRLVHRQ